MNNLNNDEIYSPVGTPRTEGQEPTPPASRPAGKDLAGRKVIEGNSTKTGTRAVDVSGALFDKYLAPPPPMDFGDESFKSLQARAKALLGSADAFKNPPPPPPPPPMDFGDESFKSLQDRAAALLESANAFKSPPPSSPPSPNSTDSNKEIL